VAQPCHTIGVAGTSPAMTPTVGGAFLVRTRG
jgi:hypothetical protein